MRSSGKGRIALDIGGTKFAAARVADDGTLEGVETTPTPKVGVWDACAALLTKVAGTEPVDRVGIGSAGPIDTVAGTTGPLNIAEWRNNFGIVAAVQGLFPTAEITFAIDGGCAALAEYRYGAARGVPNLLGMVVSTGIGGGIVLDGQIVRGRTGNAGHVGHIVVNNEDPCACGGVGCIEAVASGPSTVRWAQAQGWAGTTGIELSKAAAAGDPIGVAALHRSGTALGQAISSAAALLDVDLVVVGGGFAQSGPLLWDPLQESLRRHAGLSFIKELRVVPAELGGLGTLTGAGALTLDS